MTLFVYPPISVNTAGLATEAKQDDIISEISTANSTLTALDLKTAQVGFFTKPYDEIIPSSDATHDYYQTKLALVTQQVLTVTYADATKAVVTNYKVN